MKRFLFSYLGMFALSAVLITALALLAAQKNRQNNSDDGEPLEERTLDFRGPAADWLQDLSTFDEIVLVADGPDIREWQEFHAIADLEGALGETSVTIRVQSGKFDQFTVETSNGDLIYDIPVEELADLTDPQLTSLVMLRNGGRSRSGTGEIIWSEIEVSFSYGEWADAAITCDLPRTDRYKVALLRIDLVDGSISYQSLSPCSM